MNKTLNYYSNNASLLSTRYESASVSDLQNKKELLLKLGQPFIDDEGHVREYSEQDIFE